MTDAKTPKDVLAAWAHVLGNNASIIQEIIGRDLWLLAAENGANFYLKKYGPWRNLPLDHEAHVLRYLADSGVRVAEFLPTDSETLYAGEPDEVFVLIPQLVNLALNAADVLGSEEAIGRAVARLHLALSGYSGPVDSYCEDLRGALEGELMLPPSLAHLFESRRSEITARLADLPVQRIHGDMTPGNILIEHPGEVSGFIDFDHLPLGPRVWDIAKYVSRRLRMKWRRDDPSASDNRRDHIAPFLHGYQAVNPLASAEFAALPGLIASANVIETSYFMEISAGRLQRRMLPDHDEVMADSAEAAEWQLMHWDDVVEEVGAVASHYP